MRIKYAIVLVSNVKKKKNYGMECTQFYSNFFCSYIIFPKFTSVTDRDRAYKILRSNSPQYSHTIIQDHSIHMLSIQCISHQSGWGKKVTFKERQKETFCVYKHYTLSHRCRKSADQTVNLLRL